jgi:hypothetical protein
MRKKLSVGVALAALVVLTAVLAPAALSGGGDRDHRGYKVIELTSTVAQEGDIDVAPLEQFNVGDAFAFSDDLWKDGKKVGDDGGSCVVVRIDGTTAVVNCTATFRLPDGQITVQGLITFDESATEDPPFTVAITGGTGEFRTAHGEVRIAPGADENTDELTFRLIR